MMGLTFPFRLCHWYDAARRPSARQLVSSVKPGGRASHPANDKQTRLPVWFNFSFLGKQRGLKCAVWDVNTHIHPHKYAHMQKEHRAHGRFGIFPRSHMWECTCCRCKHTHIHTHTHTELSKKNKSLQPDMLQDTGCDPVLHLHVECNGVRSMETAVSREDNPKHSL